MSARRLFWITVPLVLTALWFVSIWAGYGVSVPAPTEYYKLGRSGHLELVK